MHAIPQVLVYGDCAVNTDPKPEELAKIGIVSADTAAAFGIQPLVAFLSYSTLGSGSGPDVEKVWFSPGLTPKPAMQLAILPAFACS